MLSAGASQSFDKLHIDQLIEAVRERVRPPSSRRSRVLLVDDNEDVHLMLRTKLEMTNVDIIGEATDGRDAVGQVQRLAPDVVVMDLRMPGMDGIEATRAIKARWPGVRVVGCTSFPTDDLSNAGADLSFQKTDTERLIQAIVEFD